jgi:hypothetical protein
LAFCGSRPLRISWLIVGMKPFTLSMPESPAVTLLNRKSAEPKQHYCRLATRMLSNVQLLPGASESQDARTVGHIATVWSPVNCSTGLFDRCFCSVHQRRRIGARVYRNGFPTARVLWARPTFRWLFQDPFDHSLHLLLGGPDLTPSTSATRRPCLADPQFLPRLLQILKLAHHFLGTHYRPLGTGTFQIGFEFGAGACHLSLELILCHLRFDLGPLHCGVGGPHLLACALNSSSEPAREFLHYAPELLERIADHDSLPTAL